MQAAQPLLMKSLTIFENNGDTKGELLALLHLASLQGVPVPVEITQRAGQMFQTHPQLISPVLQVYFHLGIAWHALYEVAWPVAEKHLTAAIETTMKSENINAYQLLALSIGPQFLFADSGLDSIEKFCLQVLNRYGDADGPLQMGTYANLSCIYFYQGKLDQAREAALRSQKIIQSLGSFAYLDMPINHVILFDLLARADYQTLETRLDALLPKLQDSDTTKAMVPGFLYIWGRALWLQDRLDECRQILKRSSSVFQYYTGHTDERQLILSALIAAREGKYAEGEAQA